jgi:hypothetical protein
VTQSGIQKISHFDLSFEFHFVFDAPFKAEENPNLGKVLAG